MADFESSIQKQHILWRDLELTLKVGVKHDPTMRSALQSGMDLLKVNGIRKAHDE